MIASILLIESDCHTQRMVANLLRGDGHQVTVAESGNEGVMLVAAQHFDLLVSAVNLTDLDGFDLCKRVRHNGFDGGVLMLTVRTSVDDRVNGLGSGADDYLAKPFESKELLARIHALLRRLGNVEPGPVSQYRFGNVFVDFEHNQVLRKGRPVSLAAKELHLLKQLIDHRGEVVSRADLLASTWPKQPFISANTLDVHVAWLRQKLEEEPQKPQFIITVRGKGYRFEPSLHVRKAAKVLGGAGLPRALDRDAEFLSAAVRTLRVAVMAVDESASIRFVNRATCGLMGYSTEEFLSLSILDVGVGLTAAQWEKTWKDMERQDSIVLETNCRTRDGRILPTEISFYHFEYNYQNVALTLVRELRNAAIAKSSSANSCLDSEI